MECEDPKLTQHPGNDGSGLTEWIFWNLKWFKMPGKDYYVGVWVMFEKVVFYGVIFIYMYSSSRIYKTLHNAPPTGLPTPSQSAVTHWTDNRCSLGVKPHGKMTWFNYSIFQFLSVKRALLDGLRMNIEQWNTDIDLAATLMYPLCVELRLSSIWIC